MFTKIKNRIEKEITAYTGYFDKLYSLNKISPLLSGTIKEFLCRKGKRIRPVLFAAGYLGFAKKPAPGLYRSAVSIELLHAFLLAHDDIIDNAGMRRGKPSMHAALDHHLSRYQNVKCTGRDLAIIGGDMMYALAMEAFLAIKEDPRRKEKALRRFIAAAFYTGAGEFVELLDAIKPIEQITEKDVYKIYDLKTARYTFASPLCIGAELAGAPEKQIDKLFRFGMCLGRAFQIKDDIIGIFNSEEEIGKPNLTDLREGKKTLLVLEAYKNSDKNGKTTIKNIFSKNDVGKKDLLEIQKIIRKSGSLDNAKKEAAKLTAEGKSIIQSSSINPRYKQALIDFSDKILSM
jgi:geranylgeranyl diphosphate synthase type I